MKQNNPKFEAHIDNKIAGQESKRVNDRNGIILSYNPLENTATVAMSGQDSDNISDITKNVPCPTYHGIQLCAPEPGRACWIAYKGGRESQPYITHFYHEDFEKYDYHKTTRAYSGVPKHLLM